MEHRLYAAQGADMLPALIRQYIAVQTPCLAAVSSCIWPHLDCLGAIRREMHRLQCNVRLSTVPDRVLQNQDLWRTATAKSTRWPSWLAEAACTQACAT